MKLSFAVVALLPHLAASSTVLETNPNGCIDPSEYDDGTDFFPQKFVPDETTDYLSVSYHNTYKIVTNLYSDKSYLLYQCGTEPPPDEVSSGKYHTVLPVPHVGGLAITETPQIPPLEMLARRSEILAYIGDPKLVSSPCLQYLMNDDDDGTGSGTIETIFHPDDPYNQTLIDPGVHEFLMRNPNAIVLAGVFGNVDGKHHISDPQTQERTAVATFDWLGMYAALFNLEGMANDIIAETKSRYECAARNAASLTSDVAEYEKPRILWAEYFDGIGWSIADCPTWDAAYYCEYAHQCGASIVSRPEGMGFNESYGGEEVYWYLTDDEFLQLGKDVETWIYPSPTFSDVYDQKSEILDQFVSVEKGQVYDTQGEGPFGWHEQRLAEYDVVALDLCSIVGTVNPTNVHNRRWFRNYFTEPIGSPGTCDVDSIDMPYVPAKGMCTPIAMTTTTTTGGGVGSGGTSAEAEGVAQGTSAAGNLAMMSVQAVAVAWIASALLA